MRLRILLTTAALTLVGVVPQVSAYNEAGHFYTAYALVHTSEVDAKRMLLVLCAQLPDMTADLDAVTVFRTAVTSKPTDLLKWSYNSKAESTEVKRMITVQQLLHALTGGDSDAVGAIARANILTLRSQISWSNPDPNQLCALGFALHFFGDAFAHRQLRDKGKMYSTGWGHALDAHYPDYALCAALNSGVRLLRHCTRPGNDNDRYVAWQDIYLHPEKTYDAEGFDASDQTRLERAALLQKVRDLGKGANDLNSWNETAMQDTLLNSADGKSDYRDFIKLQHSDRPCERVFADALKLADLAPYREANQRLEFTCKTIWDTYERSITRAFKSADPKARESLGSPPLDLDAIYVKPWK